MKVTLDGVRRCYDFALEMRSTNLGISEAKRRVTNETGMGGGSAQDYIYNVQRMLEGRSYTRTMNPEGTAAILNWIAEDFGKSALRTAATAVLHHVDYYRNLEKGGPQHKIREIALNKLFDGKKLDYSAPKISFQTLVQKSFADTHEQRLKRLSKATKRAATTVEIIPRFVRNPDVVAEVLFRAEGICEACKSPAPFITPRERPYLEVHHQIPLGEGGDDSIENALALCPNCHREAHYGQDWKKFRP